MQVCETDMPQQDLSVIGSASFLPASSLSNVYSDWNNKDTMVRAGTSLSQDKELNFSALPYNYSSLQGTIPDTSWNVGYQYNSNQFNASDTYLLNGGKILPESIANPLPNDLGNTAFEQDYINGYLKPDGVTSTDGSSLLQSQNTYNVQLLSQDALLYPLYSGNDTTNYNICTLSDCNNKVYRPSKDSFSDLLDQNSIDIETIEPETDVIYPENPQSPFIDITAVQESIFRQKESDDDSDIIVEDSDAESEISIGEAPYIDENITKKFVGMKCFVCNLSYSEQLVSSFIEVNSSFPVTFLSQTPVMLKLIEIIPTDLQAAVKFENNLICRRCLNLIDIIETLEERLGNVKKVICDFVSSTGKDKINDVFDFHNSYEDPLHLLSNEGGTLNNKTNVDKTPVMVNTGINTDITTKMISNSTTSPSKSSVSLKKSGDTSELDTQHRYQCERCGKMYKSYRVLKQHLLKHGEFKETCSECGKGFMMASNLELHMRKHQKHSCFGCRASFKTEEDLIDHIADCKETQFPCEKCALVLSSKESYRVHLQVRHNYQPRVCNICFKSFKHPSSLEAHLLSHSDEKQFKCDKCDRTYKTLSHLTRHVKSHTLPFLCRVCQSRFADKEELKSHMSLLHTSAIACDICEKLFSNKFKLLDHKRIHTGTKRQKECPICNKMILYNFSAHVKAHDNGKPFKCDFCDNRFSFKSSVVKHMKRQHKTT